MEQAAAEEKARKAAALEASRKRSSTSTPVAEAPDLKRPKLEHDVVAANATAPGFDFSSLPANLVTDLIQFLPTTFSSLSGGLVSAPGRIRWVL